MFYLTDDVETLCAKARAKRDASFGRVVTYSPKVFMPDRKSTRLNSSHT